MIKKTIKYEDLDGKTVEEDWFFHFRVDEMLELELEHGLADQFQALVDGKAEPAEAISAIKMFIQSAVGKREGSRFRKNQDILDEFNETGAYSALLLELVARPAEAAAFINSLMPAGIEEKFAEIQKSQSADVVQLPTDDAGAPKALKDMSREELLAAMREKNKA